MHHWLILQLLFFVGFVAGFVDTLSGGGGLITVPALFSVGLPPALVLGTSKLQSCIGELSASLHFFKQKKLLLRKLLPGVSFVAISASLGAVLAQVVHPEILAKIIPFLLLFVLLYTIISPRVHDEDLTPILSEKSFFVIFGLLIGFYNGFFGPGTGSFWIFVLMYFLRFNMINATIYAKPLNFIGDVLAVLWFMLGNNIDYLIAFMMGLGQILGARIGAGLVVGKSGHKIIRPLFIIVVAMMTIDLFVKNYK